MTNDLGEPGSIWAMEIGCCFALKLGPFGSGTGLSRVVTLSVPPVSAWRAKPCFSQGESKFLLARWVSCTLLSCHASGKKAGTQVSILLLYSWGPIFGVPNPFPSTMGFQTLNSRPSKVLNFHAQYWKISQAVIIKKPYHLVLVPLIEDLKLKLSYHDEQAHFSNNVNHNSITT